MRRSIPLFVGCLLITGGMTIPSAADPPRPGTTDSGLNESEAATLWSNTPPEYWEPQPGADTTIHELATEADLTFTEPPDTARQWNEYAHGRYQPGGSDVSVHPLDGHTHSYSYIEDAHASIFSVTPSTRAYVADNDERLYVAPNGTLRGTVDYRIELPDDTSNGDSTSYQLLDHDVDEVRLAVDDEVVDTMSGTASPTFEYELPFDAQTIRLEARIEATVEKTVRPPPESNRSTQTYEHDVWVDVWNDYEIEVYDIDPTVDRVTYPDGRDGISIAQSDPWQGYMLDDDTEIRGIWRFFTARNRGWPTLVASSEEGTNPHDSHAIPVSVYAYPAAATPTAKPEGTDPTIVRTWGETHESPQPLPFDHVDVNTVEDDYERTYGMAVRARDIDSEGVIVNGIVNGIQTDARTFSIGSDRIREASLSATVVEKTPTNATVQLTLENAETGAPIELDAEGASNVSNARSGYIDIDGTRVRTNADGQAVVELSEPGTYEARYEPTPWLDTHRPYTADTATIRWHPLTTSAGWLATLLQFGLFMLPFAIAWYAGRTFATMIGVGEGR